MSKQTEDKVDIWPRHPSVLTFKELSEADFKRMYLTAPNPELLRQDQVKSRIDPAAIREKPIFNGFDLADSHDRTEIMTFTPQTPPFKVVIKAVIT